MLENLLKTSNLSVEVKEYIESRIFDMDDTELRLYLNFVTENQLPTLNEDYIERVNRDRT